MSKNRIKPAPPKPSMAKPKLSHKSLYFKQEFTPMYVPVPMRTAITFRLFWWNKLSINIRAAYLTIKTKLKKADDNTTKDKT